MFRLTLAAAIGCTIGSAALANDWRSEFANITFGIASGENQQAGNLRWAPMGPYLADCMGIQSVTMRVANDYSAIIEGMAQGDIHIAWYGPAQYAIIYDLTDGDVEPVVVDISLDGDMGYRWVIAVKSDSPYQTIEDLSGRTLGWSTPTSTSGYVLPMQYFREMGYVNESNEPVLFGNMVQTGSHDNGLVSVVQGNIDATTNWYYSINAGAHVRAAGAGTIKLEDIRFIFESDLIPNAPFTTRASYPAEMRAKMRECMINMQWADPTAWEVVSRDTFGAFGLVSHEAYLPFIELRKAETGR